jgi:hypothetical protein
VTFTYMHPCRHRARTSQGPAVTQQKWRVSDAGTTTSECASSKGGSVQDKSRRQWPCERGRVGVKALFCCPSEDVKVFLLQETNDQKPCHVGSVSLNKSPYASAAAAMLSLMAISSSSYMTISWDCQDTADGVWRVLHVDLSRCYGEVRVPNITSE